MVLQDLTLIFSREAPGYEVLKCRYSKDLLVLAENLEELAIHCLHTKEYQGTLRLRIFHVHVATGVSCIMARIAYLVNRLSVGHFNDVVFTLENE